MTFLIKLSNSIICQFFYLTNILHQISFNKFCSFVLLSKSIPTMRSYVLKSTIIVLILRKSSKKELSDKALSHLSP